MTTDRRSPLYRDTGDLALRNGQEHRPGLIGAQPRRRAQSRYRLLGHSLPVPGACLPALRRRCFLGLLSPNPVPLVLCRGFFLPLQLLNRSNRVSLALGLLTL